ncbi:MAG TPA: hypothetical protein VN829_06480 [Dongiaceae bacterium]|nr:hypothetical protein [Dongiaceae bacterium]
MIPGKLGRFLLFFLGLAVGLCACAARQPALPPRHGIANFGVVNEHDKEIDIPDVRPILGCQRPELRQKPRPNE